MHDKDWLQSTVQEKLSELGGGQNWPSEAREFHLKHWTDDPFTGGMTSTCRTGFLKNFFHLRCGLKRVHFAGSETATQ